MKEKSPLTFPCDFTIKVMGQLSDHFEQKVINIVKRHIPQFNQENIARRPSKDHNYISLTITFHVETRAQLDILYEELSATPEVLMTL